MFQGIHSIVFFVRDIKQSGEWYARLLNKKPSFVSPYFMEVPVRRGLALGFHRADREKSPVSRGAQVGYWRVKNLNDALKRAVRLGGKLYRGPIPVEEHGKILGRICQVRDPFGNVFGLFESKSRVKSSTK